MMELRYEPSQLYSRHMLVVNHSIILTPKTGSHLGRPLSELDHAGTI